MKQADMRREGGFAGVFIVVAIVLSLALIGGAYLVKQRGEQARRDQAIAANDTSSSNDEATNNDEATEAAGTQQPSQDGAQSTDTSSTDTTVSDTEETNTSSQSGEVITPSNTATETTELPRTGIATDIMSILGLLLVTFSIVSYFQSRRKARDTYSSLTS